MSVPTIEVAWPPHIDLSKQSIEVPGTRKPGQTGHYRNAIWGLERLEDQNLVRTVKDLYEYGYSLSAKKPFFGRRPVLGVNPLKLANEFVWETYTEVDERIRNIGSALEKHAHDGLFDGDLKTVGIWAGNRPEWQIINLALACYNKVCVSLYDTLGKDAVEFIIKHSHLNVIFLSQQHIPSLLALRPQLEMLKLLVCIDDLKPEIKTVLSTWAKAVKVELVELRDFEALGKLHSWDPIVSSSEDISSICYTSGTTANPKGVVLTNRHLVSATLSNLHGIANIGDRDCILSYLPLAHIYERTLELGVIAIGGRIGYYSGDTLKLLEDAQILKPNFFPSVPRVLNRLYQVAMLTAKAPGIKGYLFRTALDAKLKVLHETGSNLHSFWDRVIFKKVQALLGGNVKMVSCGSAPISVEAMDFLKIALCCEVVEGMYGMTENCGTCTRVWPNDPSASGTVGAPQPVNEIKLVDVPEMGYTANDYPNPRGEICVRGDNCFVYYYKDPESSRKAVDPDGWMHTGDVGEIDSKGRFKIIDRVKNIMKLAQGEYVALEKVESIYGACPLLSQIYVHGDSLQDYLLAIVVLELPVLAEIAKVPAHDLPALDKASKDPAVKAAILNEMAKEAVKHSLHGFERVKKIHISLDPFTPENNCLTPTLKIRRRDVAEMYKNELRELYEGPGPASTAGSTSSKL